jgi:hypothetical protein
MLKVYCLQQAVITGTSDAITGRNLTLVETTLTYAVYSDKRFFFFFFFYRSGMSQTAK